MLTTWDTPRYDKLYVIGRADLAPGQQVAQAVHAAFQFAVEFYGTTESWHPGTLIVLSVPDEVALLQLWEDVRDRVDIESTVFIEPDYPPRSQHTAIALSPGESSALAVAHLPLALREVQVRGWLNTTLGHHVSGGLGKAGRLLIRLKRVRIPSGTHS